MNSGQWAAFEFLVTVKEGRKELRVQHISLLEYVRLIHDDLDTPIDRHAYR